MLTWIINKLQNAAVILYLNVLLKYTVAVTAVLINISMLNKSIALPIIVRVNIYLVLTVKISP